MKKAISVLLALCLLACLGSAACAEGPSFRKNAVTELYSAEGMYQDSVGNTAYYSYHVPQLAADTDAAKEINAEIEARFGKQIEDQMQNMEGNYSLWMWNTEWHAYWYGSQLFLLVSSDMEGDFTDYAAYGYDFEKECRVTNEMILEELGVSEEDYIANLREKVALMVEDMCSPFDREVLERLGYEELLQKTMDWQTMDEPMYIDGVGQIVTIVKIASIAGAEWYYHLATPFSYG